MTLFYALAVVAVGFHLRHGLFSALRTLGQRTANGERRARLAALGFASSSASASSRCRSPCSSDGWDPHDVPR